MLHRNADFSERTMLFFVQCFTRPWKFTLKCATVPRIGRISCGTWIWQKYGKWLLPHDSHDFYSVWGSTQAQINYGPHGADVLTLKVHAQSASAQFRARAWKAMSKKRAASRSEPIFMRAFVIRNDNLRSRSESCVRWVMEPMVEHYGEIASSASAQFSRDLALQWLKELINAAKRIPMWNISTGMPIEWWFFHSSQCNRSCVRRHVKVSYSVQQIWTSA